MNKRDYPLALARNIQSVIQECNIACIENSHLINSIEEEGHVFRFVDTEDYHTYFVITNPRYENGECVYDLILKPFNEAQTKEDRVAIKYEDYDKFLVRWLDIVRGYRELSFTPEDYFQQISEEEFFNYFVFENEDEAATKPYDLRKQILLSEILEVIEHVIEKSESIEEDVKAKLINSAVELKETITSKTQKAVAKGFAKLFATLKKHGISTLKEVGKEITKKSATKLVEIGIKVFTEGMNFIAENAHTP